MQSIIAHIDPLAAGFAISGYVLVYGITEMLSNENGGYKGNHFVAFLVSAIMFLGVNYIRLGRFF